MNVSSRGRAALREAHGLKQFVVLTLKGSDDENGCTLSGSDLLSHLPWASRKAARPRLLTFILSGWFGCGLNRAA